MKKIIYGVVAVFVLMLVYLVGKSVGTGSGETPAEPQETSKSLNISIYLDLSDRLVRDLVPNQTYRDTAIINCFVDYFIKKNVGPTLLRKENQNKIKVFFYPTPNDSEIATLARGLSVDMGAMSVAERGDKIDTMRETFQKNLKQIYEETLSQHNWIGCDIWDFFSSKKVDNLCVKPGARNIVVILTDGYIFAANNRIREGSAYSYILPQTLSVPNSSLIDRRNGDLKDKGLEVLVLEVNPYQPSDRDKMIRVLENWFSGMGIEKFVVAETDANMTNTQTIIMNFLEE